MNFRGNSLRETNHTSGPVAYNLEWDSLEMEDGEVIRVYTFTLDEALAATREDYRCDFGAAFALWLFAESGSK